MPHVRKPPVESGAAAGPAPPGVHGSGADSKNRAPWEDSVRNPYLLRALLIALAFLLFSFAFFQYTSALAREDAAQKILTATDQIKFALEDHIGEQFLTLHVMALGLDTDGLLTDPRSAWMLNGTLRHAPGYTRVGVADGQGRAVWIVPGGRTGRGDISGDPAFARALAGEDVLTRTRTDEASGVSVNGYAVPIHGEDDSIRGVLFASVPEDELRTIMKHTLYAGRGVAHIADGDGKYIVMSDSPLSLATGGNVFDIARPLAGDIALRIREDLKAGRSGQISRTFSGENRLVAYAPLNINGWNVFYAVPEPLVSEGMRTIVSGAASGALLAMAVFALLLLLIRQAERKNRRALERLAFEDPVTGRRNFQKFLLDARAALAARPGEAYAVCYADIKGFKYINDLFGREAGDRLLKHWSDIQAEISREGEVFGRVGGDVFVALRRYDSRAEILAHFERVCAALAKRVRLGESAYRVELYGGAYLTGEAGEALSLDDMLDRANTAQKAVKTAATADRFGFYSDEMRARKLWESEVEGRMAAALAAKEFQVYLQPKIGIQRGNRVHGAEALIRWQPPGKDIIPPGRFIALYERNGFIVRLDRFVLETACRHYRRTVLEGGLPPYVLSVNVSRIGLHSPDFIRAYAEVKERYGIPDGRLELEFTESLVFEDHARFRSIVEACRENGFLCALDDFGAGYSSLNLLKSLRVDVLKLDGLFFRDGGADLKNRAPQEDSARNPRQYEDDAARGHALVRNIIALAKALGMQTVAEGVESPDEVGRLREMGCDAVQGYVFAKPMPLDEFDRFLAGWEAGRA